jgi:hypothetical protein
VPAARVRLNAIAASTSQAEFAANDLWQMSQGTTFQVGVDLFDDRVLAVALFGVQHRHRIVGEHGVVSPGGEQGILTGRDAGGIEAFDAAHDQPGADVLVLAS